MIPEIDEETKAWLESLPKKKNSLAFNWTEELDKKLWAAKGKVKNEILCKELGCCQTIMIRRYYYLKDKWGNN